MNNASDLLMGNASDLLMDNNSSTIDESLWDEQQQGAGALDPLAELLSLLDDPSGSQDGRISSMSEDGAVDISSLDVENDFSSLLALLTTPPLGHSEYSDPEHDPPTPPMRTIAPRDAVIVAPPTPPAYQSGLCAAVKDITSGTAAKPAPTPQPAASQLALPPQPYRVGVAGGSSTPAHFAPTAVHPATHPAQMDPRLVAQMQQVRAMQLAQAQAQQQANLRMQMQMQMYQFAYLQQRHYYAQQQQQQQQQGPGPGPIRSAASNSSNRAVPYNTVPSSRRSKATATAPPQPAPSPVASTSAAPSQPARVGMQQALTLPADDLLVMGWTART